jgi:hypothetical protein
MILGLLGLLEQVIAQADESCHQSGSRAEEIKRQRELLRPTIDGSDLMVLKAPCSSSMNGMG